MKLEMEFWCDSKGNQIYPFIFFEKKSSTFKHYFVLLKMQNWRSFFHYNIFNLNFKAKK